MSVKDVLSFLDLMLVSQGLDRKTLNFLGDLWFTHNDKNERASSELRAVALRSVFRS